MAQKKRGLGRGLQALIPEAQTEIPSRRPTDVFFPESRAPGPAEITTAQVYGPATRHDSLEDDDGRGLGRGLATCRGDRLDSARALEADSRQAIVAPGHRDEAPGRRGQAQVRQGQVRIRVRREVRGDEDGASAQ